MFQFALAVALAGASVPTTDLAPTNTVTESPNVSIVDPRAIVAALQSHGYRAELDLSGKVPEIRSGAGGWNYSIYFQGCEEGRNCHDLLFYAAWDHENGIPTLEQINAFNRKSRFVRAYLDEHSDPVLEMDLVFTGHQVGSQTFKESLDIWQAVISSFANHIKAD